MQALMERPSTGAWKYTAGPVVNHLVHGLLLSGDVDYERVADRIRCLVPGAKTTVKSVASTATRLRSQGHEIPYRHPQVIGSRQVG